MSGRPDIRLLLADIDGTLVTQEKVLTEAAKAAARDLGAAGIALALTSARPPRGMRMLIEPLALQTVLAGFNGGLYVRPDLSVIRRHAIGAATARTAVNLFLAEGLDVWVYTEKDWMVCNPNGPHVAREAWILQFDAKVVTDFSDDDLAQPLKIVGVSDDLPLVAACEAKAQKALGNRASATRSEPHFLDVTHPRANKGAVVLTLARRLNIAPQQIATIGDMPNDVMMFKKSGFSIAMGNASDPVKAQASVVTDSNEEDGFAKAVRRFLLPSAPAGKRS
ncbi:MULTISPECIES: Cof-type HAD-IIB family hydrolase [unclassified Brevundimonas]|uniref:Cof-type HAD-IIB family hydrolase n=1 Tax=unclassified Brevundimonas TaxID=2622653 RepID=UPI003F907E45